MMFFEMNLEEEFIYSLGWMILHSFWQGAICFSLLAFILRLFKRLSSQSKYLISVFMMLMLLVITFITFYYLYNDGFSEAGNKQNYVNSTDEKPIMLFNNDSGSISIFRILINYLNDNIHFIVRLWIIGIPFIFFRYLNGLLYSRKLKSEQTHKIPDTIINNVKLLKNKLNLDKPIRLISSSLIKIPSVIGHLKPVIILPVEAITQLPFKQLEIIILHELAHIKRNDYIINLIQSIVELLFFFNPFVWWISAKINDERENCCDDIAIKVSGDPLNFAKAITGFKEINIRQERLTLAFVNKKYPLFNRIKRQMEKNKPISNYLEKFFNSIIIILVLTGVFIYYQSTSTITNSISNEITNIKKLNNYDQYEDENGNKTIVHYKKGIFIDDKIEVIAQNNNIKSVKVNGQAKGNKEYQSYKYILDYINYVDAVHVELENETDNKKWLELANKHKKNITYLKYLIRARKAETD